MFGTEVFAYNSNYLNDVSWVDNPSAVTKSVGYDSDNGVRSCSISYLVDEMNSSIYFQVLANNFGIKKDSNVRLYFDVSADGQNYSFFITKNGLQSDEDLSKKFDAGTEFSSSTSADSGIYLAALDIKTKASTNKIDISIYIDDSKYELIDGITLNAVTTTKKPTTTKIKVPSTSRIPTTEAKSGSATVTVVDKDETTKKKSRTTKGSTTKFSGSGKYISSGKVETATSKYTQAGTTAKSQSSDETTQSIVHALEKSKRVAQIQDKIMLGSGVAIGAIGLILIGYAIGKASDKASKNKSNADANTDNPDDEKIIDEDDFEF